VKPPRGTGLNKPAIISLHNCWPAGEETQTFVAALQGVKNTTFLDYCHQTGTWIFRVEHFTRYGLPGDDDDEDEDDDDEAGEDGAELDEGEDADREMGDENEELDEDERLEGDEGDYIKTRKMLEFRSDEDESIASDEDRQEYDDADLDEDELSPIENESPIGNGQPLHPFGPPKLPQQLGLEPRKFQLMKV